MKIESICSFPMLMEIFCPQFPIVSGNMIVINETHYFPELEIDQPKKDDTSISKTGIAKTSQNNPLTPKHPQKKPSPPENALIADTGERRKTRRS